MSLTADILFDRSLNKEDITHIYLAGPEMVFGGHEKTVRFAPEAVYKVKTENEPAVLHVIFSVPCETEPVFTRDDAETIRRINSFPVSIDEDIGRVFRPKVMLAFSFSFNGPEGEDVADITGSAAVREFSFVPKVRTRLQASRTEGLQVTISTTLDILHDKGVDVLEMMDRCFSDWYKTPKGNAAWVYTCGDLNVGDMLAGEKPDDSFTKLYGFVIMPEEDIYRYIDLDYDRVFGNYREEE